MRVLRSRLLLLMILATAAVAARANPKDTQIIWGSYNGVIGTTWATSATLNANGRYVAFYSENGSLVPGGSPPGYFVQDRHTLYMRWIREGTGTPSLSADGQTIAYSDNYKYSELPGIFAGSVLVSLGRERKLQYPRGLQTYDTDRR